MYTLLFIIIICRYTNDGDVIFTKEILYKYLNIILSSHRVFFVFIIRHRYFENNVSHINLYFIIIIIIKYVRY